MFWCFDQNNSGGRFVFDTERGLSTRVWIEANHPDEANARAEAIGIYFNGCDAGVDCECCGDRWDAALEGDRPRADDLDDVLAVEKRYESFRHRPWNSPDYFIHTEDGRVIAGPEWRPKS